jgi:streptogramin lyase
MRFGLISGWASKLFVAALVGCSACSSSEKGDSPSEQGGAAGAGNGMVATGGKSHAGAGGKSSSPQGGNDSQAGSDAGASGAGSEEYPELPAELWYGGVSLCGFASEQLTASGSSDPAVKLAIASLEAVSDVALDAHGNAWVVGVGSNTIFRFPAESLMKKSAKPDLQITSASLTNPGNLVFDAKGGLWIATRPSIKGGTVSDGSVLRFDVPTDATGELDLDPSAELSSPVMGDFTQIGSLAFDAAQNLWVASFAGLLRFDDPTTISDSVEREPDALIDKSGYQNIQFYSLAFDREGALWVTSADGLHYLTSINKFEDPGSLEGVVIPEPAVTIKGAADLLPAGGLAFDSAGNLWAATSAAIFEYKKPGSLHGEVNPDPDVALAVKGDAGPTTYSHLTFYPPPGLR